ncbi:hypothetical protein CgunFtcFv8_009946 [Champsocephalus gunnari]|uniref:Uncharacterized protein n=1 Tax=Champsocephalus gunnari TaxID=52237 RepID=A0AAN8GYR0_CHAGU|nr:hypothetical protein CgunFtcFv8_009946 [Champsocephalus gunnari]
MLMSTRSQQQSWFLVLRCGSRATVSSRFSPGTTVMVPQVPQGAAAPLRSSNAPLPLLSRSVAAPLRSSNAPLPLLRRYA